MKRKLISGLLSIIIMLSACHIGFADRIYEILLETGTNVHSVGFMDENGQNVCDIKSHSIKNNKCLWMLNFKPNAQCEYATIYFQDENGNWINTHDTVDRATGIITRSENCPPNVDQGSVIQQEIIMHHVDIVPLPQDQRYLSRTGPGRNYHDGGAFKSYKFSRAEALFIENGFVYVDFDYTTVGTRRLYFPQKMFADLTGVEEISLTHTETGYVLNGTTPRFGPGYAYDEFRKAQIPSGKQIEVIGFEDGWAFSEFECALGTVRAWIPADNIEYKSANADAARNENDHFESEGPVATFENTAEGIIFGRYEQDGNESNGPEPILWDVIEQDGDKLLLISKYALTSSAFHRYSTKLEWQDSKIRSWLNQDFYREAFHSSERKALLKMGSGTKDYVTLLSRREAEDYANRADLRTVPTVQAIRQGINRSDKNILFDNQKCSWWWLRSADTNAKLVDYVRSDGGFAKTSGMAKDGGVRPVILVDSGRLGSSYTDEGITGQSENHATNGRHSQANQGFALGATVTFGHYEQDGDTANGSEPLLWNVIRCDNNHALLISKYALNASRFHLYSSKLDWKDSKVKSWLNREFYQQAFSNAERKSMRIVDLNTADQDYVTLLSKDEALRFCDSFDLQSVPTTQAIYNGINASNKNISSDSEKFSWWWLRSVNKSQKSVDYVMSDGSFGTTGGMLKQGGIRPVILIELDGGDFR